MPQWKCIPDSGGSTNYLFVLSEAWKLSFAFYAIILRLCKDNDDSSSTKSNIFNTNSQEAGL